MTILGKQVSYADVYNPSILEPISRGGKIYFGEDIWRCYEFSWLNSAGMPQHTTLTFKYPCSSSHIIESKSLKLYLHGFSFKRFENLDEVKNRVREDLSPLLGTTELDFSKAFQIPTSRCIDSLLVKEPSFKYDKSLLMVTNVQTQETVSSNLFRSLCPVTGQPDWATVIISYKGYKIAEESILRYIFSLRRHQGFHEQCCELIYDDILELCGPTELTVVCDFTRRGGISITPIRSTQNW